jgi:hypothetical protein
MISPEVKTGRDLVTAHLITGLALITAGAEWREGQLPLLLRQ